MPQIILEIPDKVYDRVIDNVCTAYGYVEGDKLAFIQKLFLNQIFEIVKSQEGDLAAETSRKAAEDKVESEVILEIK